MVHQVVKISQPIASNSMANNTYPNITPRFSQMSFGKSSGNIMCVKATGTMTPPASIEMALKKINLVKIDHHVKAPHSTALSALP